MQLRNVVSHLVTLFHTVFELVILNELNIFAQALIVVANLSGLFQLVHRCVKLDDDRLTDSPI